MSLRLSSASLTMSGSYPKVQAYFASHFENNVTL